MELPPVQKDRDGCLSIYLAFSLVASVIALVLFLGLALDPRSRILPAPHALL
jgi:hypothetical protein